MVSQSRLLLIAAAGVFAFAGCFGDIWEQAQNAAVRKQTFDELKQYSSAWFAHHDTHNRGPDNWQELNQFAPGGLQQTLEGKGYQFVWSASFPQMRVGTSNTIMAYPSDAATNGGLVAMADGSAQLLTAEEFNQKFNAQDVGNRGAARGTATTGGSAPPSATTGNAPPGPPSGATNSTTAPASSPAFTTPAPSTANAPQAIEGPAPTFTRGQTAYVEYAGKWEPVEILEVLSGDKYKIRWTNWGPQWDEIRSARRIAASVPAGGVAADRRGPAPSSSTTSSRPLPHPPGGDDAPGSALAEGSVVAAGQKVHAYWFGKWQEGEVVETSTSPLVKVRVPSPVPGAPPQEIPLPRHWVRSMGAAPPPAATASSPAPSASPPPAATASRTWTDSSGKFTIEAKYISFDGGQVTLQQPDGKQLRLPLDKLSAADRTYVTEQASRP